MKLKAGKRHLLSKNFIWNITTLSHFTIQIACKLSKNRLFDGKYVWSAWPYH